MEISEKLVKVISNIESTGAPKIISICGAADLGKSYLSAKIQDCLKERGLSSAHLTMDSYLIPRSKRIELGVSGYEIAAYGIDLLKQDLELFLQGKTIEFSEYDHELGVANGPKHHINTCSYLILDGLHSMNGSLREFIDYSIFIYATDSLLNDIRHQADILKRRQSVEFSLRNLELEHEKYKVNIEPYKYEADMVIELVKKWQYVEQC